MPTFIAISAVIGAVLVAPANAVGAEIFSCHRCAFPSAILRRSAASDSAANRGRASMSQATRILLALVVGLLLGIALANWAPDAGAIVLLRSRKPIGGAWLHGLQMVIVPLVVGAAGHRHRRHRRGGAGRADRRRARWCCSSSILWVNDDHVGAADAAAARAVPAARRAGARRCAPRCAAPRRSGQVPALGRFLRHDRADQRRRRRGERRVPAADRVRAGLRLRDHPAAPRRRAAADRLLPGDRRRDAGGDRLGAGARADRRVRAGVRRRRARPARRRSARWRIIS